MGSCWEKYTASRRYISISVESRFVAVFNRRDTCLDIKKPIVQSSTAVLNAYGNRKPTTPKGQPTFRRVTKGYLPRGGRGCVKRRGGAGRVPLTGSLPRRALAVGTKWNSIFDYAGFAYFPPPPALRKLERLSTHKHGITIRGSYPRSDPFFRPSRTGQTVLSSWLSSLCEW